MKYVWPTYKNHNYVICKSCGRQLDANFMPEESGYPQGRWMKDCDCHFITFYDVEEDE